MIIHSLCHRYSPSELQLYLLDFKEGVTFKAFSNIGQDEYLPHAQALGLESDSSFGLAVLTFLFREYQRRMKILKDYNLKSIRELRLQERDMPMPRILVIIDEFQLMFDDMQTGQKIADMLEYAKKALELGGDPFGNADRVLQKESEIDREALKKEEDEKEYHYKVATTQLKAESVSTLEEAIQKLSMLGKYKDSAELIEKARTKIKNCMERDNQRETWKRNGLCIYCGGRCKGLIVKKCSSCGREQP